MYFYFFFLLPTIFKKTKTKCTPNLQNKNINKQKYKYFTPTNDPATLVSKFVVCFGSLLLTANCCAKKHLTTLSLSRSPSCRPTIMQWDCEAALQWQLQESEQQQLWQQLQHTQQAANSDRRSRAANVRVRQSNKHREPHQRCFSGAADAQWPHWATGGRGGGKSPRNGYRRERNSDRGDNSDDGDDGNECSDDDDNSRIKTNSDGSRRNWVDNEQRRWSKCFQQ